VLSFFCRRKAEKLFRFGAEGLEGRVGVEVAVSSS
jgi:hypothetical protein